jgi:phage terminase small subunit
MLPATVTATEIADGEDRRFPHLTAMQEAFVTNYVLLGGNGARAARNAGYAKSSAAVEASKLLRKAPIATAIMELLHVMQARDVVEATETTRTLMRTSKSDYVRLEAAKDIRTRAGMQAPARVHHTGGVSINIDLS